MTKKQTKSHSRQNKRTAPKKKFGRSFTIVKSKSKGVRVWRVLDKDNKIVTNKKIERGDTIPRLLSQFNKKTLSFDQRLKSIRATKERNAQGKYIVQRIYETKPLAEKRVQTMVFADVYVTPSPKGKRRYCGRYEGYSHFGKGVNDAKNFIFAQLWKDGKVKSSNDTVEFEKMKVVYSTFSTSKRRPKNASRF